ncbi:MAG: AAA family ATPase [Pyrinomonadaceae bacterium]
MHISKIELENIKSHVSSTFEFTRGTTAITGDNGSGKTTIIEGIAWALFDFLPEGYKKEDFVRRGAKKGSVSITFESDLDERDYVVYRDSSSGHNVTDPRLQIRIADKKEEVFRFLWQHLRLDAGTDLRSLFRQAVGVPQGTFTAIFLEGATERKTAFDRLLKVEEYRQAAEKLRDTSKYLDRSIAHIREEIARAEGELKRSEFVEGEYKDYQEQREKLAGEVETLEKQIEAKRIVVEKLDEMERIETAVANVKAEQKRMLEGLEDVQKARKEIDSLKPKVIEQDKIGNELVGLHEKIAVAKVVEEQKKSADERLERLRSNYKTNLEQLHFAEEKAKFASDVVTLEKQDFELVQTIASLRARLETDEKFQSQIKNGVCPVLSEKCLNLKPGQTLEAFVSSQFSNIKSKIAAFENEKKSVDGNLNAARDAERFAATIDGLRRRVEEVKNEGTQLSAEREELAKKINGHADLEKQLTTAEGKLKALGNPRSRTMVLENETARENEFRENLTKVESNLERLETERRVLFEELDEFREVIGDKYDNSVHAEQKKNLNETEKLHAGVRATYKLAREREEQLAAELKRFADLRKSLQMEFQEKERLESVAEATGFIRDTLKEAAPIVAKNYIRHVSLEANQTFREITGKAERNLKWTEDYSIRLEEDGYERPYQSFSGGEQMAAALAVRLALLKQLTDIRIAFFDEPTTNMDAERRENFAQAVSRITHFDQLFVISHDDTFDSYVDNVITLA